MTSLSNNSNTVTTSAAISNAKISSVQPPLKSPTVKSISNPLSDTAAGNNQHPELHQTNSTSNQLLTTSIIRKPITSSTTFDNTINKTVQNNINYTASASNPSSSSSNTLQQIKQTTTVHATLIDPSNDLIKHSAKLNNNINVLNSIVSSNQLPNNLDFVPIDGCINYYNRTEVSHHIFFFKLCVYFCICICKYLFLLIF